MKLKKLFALALAVCMMVSVMPTSFAGNGFLSLDGAQPTTTTTGPSLTLDTPGTVSGGSVVTPRVSPSSQNVYTPYVYSNPYSVGTIADEGEEAAPQPSDTEVLDNGGNGPDASYIEGGEKLPETDNGVNDDGTTGGGNSGGTGTDNGLELEKSVVENNDGTATVTLKVHSTGTVTTSTEFAPTDIVLAIYLRPEFGDDYTGFDSADAKWQALAYAVNEFLDEVVQKNSEGSSYRVAEYIWGKQGSRTLPLTVLSNSNIDTYKVDAAVLKTWSSGASNNMMLGELLTTINSTESGVQWSPDSSHTLIVFTDAIDKVNGAGYKTAYTQADAMKNNGVTVYSVGVFSGADPTADITGCSDNSYGNISRDDYSTSEAIKERNYYMHRVSSNYPTSSGITGKYKAAGNAAELEEVFTEIYNEIASSGSTLNSSAVIKDIVTPYFSIPSDARDITLQTAAYDGNSFGTPQIVNGLTVVPSGSTVSVTGFDFSKTFVTTRPRTVEGAPYYGEQLIITFTITPKDSFLGGTGISTNGAQSGVYADADATEPVEIFNNAAQTVTMPLKPLVPNVQSYNIYLSNPLDLRALLSTTQDVRINGTNNAYVAIVYTIEGVGTFTIPAGGTLKNGIWELAPGVTTWETNSNGTYSISCKVVDKGDKTNFAETDIDPDTEGNQYPTATVTVFKPHITFNDSTIYLGDWANYADNPDDSSVVWLDDDDNLAKDMTGAEPSVTVTYNLDTGYFDGCKDISVKTVELGDTEVALRDVTFENDDDDENAGHHFTVHVLYPSVNYQNSTVHLGFTPDADYHKTNNLVSDGKFITWTDRNTDHDIESETSNDDSSFNYSFTPVDNALTKCTPVTATITVKTVPKVTADEDEFTVHVVRPTITFADQVIYLSKQPDYITLSDPDEVSAFGWNSTCTEGTKIGETAEVPAVTGTVAPADFTIDYDELETDPFLDCTPVNATVKFGSSDDAPDYTAYVVMKNGDTVCGADAPEFTVHVLKPDFAVSGTDLYADYGTDLGLDYKKEGQEHQAIAWSNEWKCATESCKDVKGEEDFIGDDADKATVSQVVYKVAHTPENAGVLAQDPDTKKWSYTVKTDDDDFTVELNGFKIGSTLYNSANWAGVTYDGDATKDQAAFTIYVNKFELTINTDWTKSSGEQQSAIFTVTPDTQGDANLMPIKVVVPKGVNSVVIAGLFCGQKYTIAEDNDWTWRYGSAAEAVYGEGEDRIACVGGLRLEALNGTDDVTMSFDDGNTYNPKWLADEACVVNKLNKNGVAVAMPVRTKEEYEEVTNA